MSLRDVRRLLSASGFPRVSGDEPIFAQIAEAMWVFSPRERG